MSQLDVVLQLLPSSYSVELTSVGYRLWDVAAAQLDDVEALIGAIYGALYPQDNLMFGDEWETELGLPSGAELDAAERAARIVARLRERRDLSPTTIKGVMEAYLGYEPEIIEWTSFRTDDPDSLTDDDLLIDGLIFEFYVVVDEAQERVDFDLAVGQALLDLIKPAWTRGLLLYDVFRCDDPRSLTDRDLLGS